jgi:glycosyltransferase involved in cell wall biosynthesis
MMPEYFSLTDALLVQLRKDSLFSITIPSKLQTYMASGRPIIGALEDDGAEVVMRSGCGLVCEPGNPTKLKEAILKMYHFDFEERLQMGLRAREYFDRYFNRDVLLDRLEKIMLEYS